MFGSFILLLERSQNGAFFSYPAITSLRLYDFIDGKGTFLIVIYVLFVVVFAYNLQGVSMAVVIFASTKVKSYYDIRHGIKEIYNDCKLKRKRTNFREGFFSDETHFMTKHIASKTQNLLLNQLLDEIDFCLVL